jgi:hypothetical protein
LLNDNYVVTNVEVWLAAVSIRLCRLFFLSLLNHLPGVFDVALNPTGHLLGRLPV